MSTARNLIISSLLAVAVLIGLLIGPPSRKAGPSGAAVRPLLVYCAAGLKEPMEAVAHAYRLSGGVPIQLQFGGSGSLLGNLRVARRGDLFLAADDSFLDQARSQGLIAETFPLARLVPVIVVRRDLADKPRTLADLERPGFRIALANPETAAIGKVGRDLLVRAGRWATLQAHVRVLKPTVNDLANDVRLGSVEASIVWDATVAQYPELQAIHVPELDAGSGAVALAVLTSSDEPAAALRFARYVSARDGGLSEFARRGFTVERGDLWRERPEVLISLGEGLRGALEETLRNFEEREKVTITRIYQGRGGLPSPIRAGQRPDAVFVGDVSSMDDLGDDFSTAVSLTESRPVILVPKGNPGNLRSLGDLARPGLAVGLVAAQFSELGVLTARLLRSQNLGERVMGNVTFAAPTVELLRERLRAGALGAAIVGANDAGEVRDGYDVIEVPATGPLAIQAYAISRDTSHPRLLERLLVAVRSAESRRRFEQAGFYWRHPAAMP